MKTIAYLRKSTLKQETSSQRYGIDEYCKKNDMKIDEYIEETAHRYKKNKNIWPALLELSKGDIVIVSEISRIAGSVMQSFEFMKICLEKEIIVHFIKQRFILEEDNMVTNAIMFGYGMAAKVETDLISDRTKEALQRKKSEGMQLGRRFKDYKVRPKYIYYLKQSGESGKDIAKLFGIHETTVSNISQAIKRGEIKI